MGKALWPALGAAILLAVPSTASAGVIRHASPDGMDTASTCTDGEQPCSLKRAVETVAMNGDEVVLAPGVYNPPSTVAISKPLTVHGQDGQPAPRVVRTAGQVFSVAGVERWPRSGRGDGRSDWHLVRGRAGDSAGGSRCSPERRGGDGQRQRSPRQPRPHRVPHGRAVLASYGVVHLVNVTAVATDPGSSAVYGDSAVGGICVPSSRIEIDATNVIARGGAYDFDIPPAAAGAATCLPRWRHVVLELPPREV